MTIAILLSGGTGSRLGEKIPKQYIRVADQMIITYSLKTLLEHNEIDGVIIVAEEEWHEQILADIKQRGQHIEKIIGFSVPGVTRQFSIYHALCKIAEMNEKASDAQKYGTKQMDIEVKNILIHDAARPNLTLQLISACVLGLKEHEGVLPVLPMKDTIYYSRDEHSISQLLDRKNLFAGQAPEGFHFDAYYRANQKLLPDKLKQINGSTEVAVLAGMDVGMIAGDENNFKITTKTDLQNFLSQIEDISK